MQAAPLYTLLTVPKLLMRVPRIWLYLSAMASALVAEIGVLFGHLLLALIFAALVFITMWIIGYIQVRWHDPEFINIFIIKYMKIKRTKTAFPKLFRGNRYVA